MAYFNGRKILLAGLKGESGTTPHIGPNGNWFIGDVDMGVAAGGPPPVTSEHDGKIMQVVNGEWAVTDDLLSVKKQLGGDISISSPTNQNMNLSGDADVTKTTAHTWAFYRPEGYVGTRLNKISVVTSGAGTVRFALYARKDTEDGTSSTLTLEKILGDAEADTDAGSATLTIDGGYYTETERPFVMCCATASILGCMTLGSVVFKDALVVKDVDYYNNAVGDKISCEIGSIEAPAVLVYSMEWEDIRPATVKEFADNISKRMANVEKNAISVDMVEGVVEDYINEALGGEF